MQLLSGRTIGISPVPISADAVAWLLGSRHLDASRESLIGFTTSSPIGIVVHRWAGTPGYAGIELSTALVHDDWWVFLDHAYLQITTEKPRGSILSLLMKDSIKNT